MSDIIKTVYLCGPITGCSYGDAANWRQYVASKVASNVRVLDPMRCKDFLKNEEFISQSYEEHEEWLFGSERHFFSRDVMDVLSGSDMVLANFLGASIVSVGSIAEMGMSFAKRTPIVMVMEKEGNIHDHPFTRQMAGWRVDELDKAIQIINATIGTLGSVSSE